MAKEDLKNMSATNEGQENAENGSAENTQLRFGNGNGDGIGAKVGQAAGSAAKDVAVRTGNRLKKGMKEFGKAASAFLAPLKKYVIIGIAIAAAIALILILITAAFKYLLEIDSIKANNEKEETFRDTNQITSMNIDYLFGYRGQTSDIDEFIDTIEFYMGQHDQVFTRLASTSRAKKVTSLDNFLFIGDSRYEGIETQLTALGTNIVAKGVGSSFPQNWIEPIKNGGGTVSRGVGDGVQTKNIGTLPDTVDGISVMLGVNGVTGANQVSDMKEVLNALHSRYPDVPIFVNSVYHLGTKYSGDYDQMNTSVDKFNEEMKKFCDSNDWAIYIDVTSGLNDSSGYLQYNSDGLHLDNDGKKILVNNIKTAIMSSDAGVVTVDSILAEMTLEEKINQMLMVQGVVSDGNSLSNVNYGGYIVANNSNYNNNLGKIGSNYKVAPFIATDDEGGTVKRAATQYTTNARTYGDNKNYTQLSTDETEKSNYLLGLGINLNLGPVTDVISNGALYDRSFSGDPAVVKECIKTIIEARKKSNLNGVSISSSLKHYPGYPDTSVNTDFEVAQSDRTMDDINKNIEVFKEGANAGAQSIMVSNVIYTNYDKNNPASLSPTIVGDLRKNFSGVIMTDDIGDAKGVGNRPNRFKEAILAGNDMILLWDSSVTDAYNQINQAVTNGEITENSINESVKRILEWKADVGLLNVGSSSSNNQNNSSTTQSGGRTTETITICENENGEKCIAIDLDNKVDKIYKSLKENNNALLSRFDNKTQAKESIKLWCIAEYSSQYVNLSADPENYEHDYEADYIQGIVKVKRYEINDDGTETEKYLTYKTQDEFDTLKANYEASGDKTVFNHFTINSQDDLVIAYYRQENQTSEYTEGNADPKKTIPAEENYTTYEVRTQPLNYRNAIVQYTMPYFLFVTLTMYGNDAEFTNEIARLIADSEMVIGIRDTVTTTVTTEYDRYLREEKTREYARIQASAQGTTKESSGTFYRYAVNPVGGEAASRIVKSRDVEAEFSTNAENTKLVNISETPYYETKTVNTVISNSVAMNIEYIDGWCFNHEMKYEAKVTDTSSGPDVTNVTNEEYTTTKAYDDGKVTNLTDKLKIAELMQKDSVRTIHSEAVKQIIDAIGDQILLEAINRELATNYLYGTGRDTNAHRVLRYYFGSNSNISLARMIISGNSSAIDNIGKELLNSLGIEVTTDEEVAAVRTEVRTLYNSIAGALGSEQHKNEIFNRSIGIKIVDYGREDQERIVNRTITTNTDTNTKQYNKISTETIEKTDKNPEAGEENFVSILCDKKYAKAKHALTGSTARWFFETIEKEQDTACLLDLLKYLFYKATNHNYGVTEFDFSKGLTIVDITYFQNTSTIVGDTVQAKIWFGLKSLGYSDMQIAAAMGNFEHEAGFITKNIEDAAEYKYGNNQTFTDGVNSGSISKDTFVNGTYVNKKGKICIYGYGLAQWSAAERKDGLYEYAKHKQVPIDDENMQVEYLIAEITGSGAEGFAKRAITEATMTDYTGINYYARDWYNATSDELDESTLNHITLAFCYTFERPAVSADSEASRKAAALRYYNEFHGKTLSGGDYTDSSLDFVQGEFTSGITGKTFLIYDQSVLFSNYGCGDIIDGKRKNNWCNHYTAASIASGYRGNATEMSLIDASRNTSNLLSVYGVTNNYLAPYGLEVESIDDNYSYSMDTMKKLLQEGKYIAIYFKGETLGKSGSKYSQSGSAHWIAVLGYRVENNEEQIYIGNAVSSWGNGWRSLDEFEVCQSKISHFTVIKEK